MEFRSADDASSVFANSVHACAVQLTPFTAAVMADNEIIEHHDDEEMEKRATPRSHSHSFLESVTSLDDHNSTQSSHRLLAYSDALIAIIATVMVRRAHAFNL